MKVLIIEDDPEIIEAIRLAFQIRWPEATVIASNTGEDGVTKVEAEKPDIMILDLGLPDISGFEVLKQVRDFSNVPVLILSVRSEESSIVKGLEWGADDYVVKPFRQLELLSRVKALLRKHGPAGAEGPLTCGLLSFNPATEQFFYGSDEKRLTNTEGRILHHLMKNWGQVVPHAGLAEAVWGDEDYPAAADSLKVYIRRIREKIEPDAAHPQLILTKSGIGYILAKPG